MRFASKRCSARTPARDVMSALGRSVDVRDSMENMVSVMIGPLVPSAQTKMDPPVILYASAPTTRGSSFCARSTLRAMSLRMSKWRTRNKCPSLAVFAPSAFPAFGNEARHALPPRQAR